MPGCVPLWNSEHATAVAIDDNVEGIIEDVTEYEIEDMIDQIVGTWFLRQCLNCMSAGFRRVEGDVLVCYPLSKRKQLCGQLTGQH